MIAKTCQKIKMISETGEVLKIFYAHETLSGNTNGIRQLLAHHIGIKQWQNGENKAAH